MKKTILTFMAIVAIAITATAQKSGYSKNDKLLNIGIGVNSYYNNGIPIGVSFEKGISDVISVGADFNYLSSNYDLGYGYNLKFTAMYFGARASYHFNEIIGIDNEKLDFYGGATLGYRNFSWSDNTNGALTSELGSSYGSGAYLGAFIGGKYYFTDKIGALLELGAIGSTNARIGVAFKF